MCTSSSKTALCSRDLDRVDFEFKVADYSISSRRASQTNEKSLAEENNCTRQRFRTELRIL